MGREEYLEQLACLLQDISENERDEALEFYRDYFEEAEGDEASVIAALGSPEKVAAQIKNGLKEDKDAAGQYTETGYQDERFREDSKVPVPKDGYPIPGKRRSGLTIGLIVILCILLSPLLISIAGVGIGLIASVFGIAAAIVILIISLTFAALICGVALFGAGIVNLFTVPAVGCLLMGGGLLSLALGILLVVGGGWILARFVPWFVRGIVHVCSRIFRRGGKRS